MAVYDPNKHCGATNRAGTPCTRPKGWGTPTPGSGRCKLHGGRSRGAVTEAGQRRSSENSTTHGLYGTVMKGKDLARLKTVRNYSNGAIIQSSFEMVNAKLLGVVDGDVRITQKYAKLYGVAEVMAESGEFDEEDLRELKLRLAGVDLEKLTRISLSAASLANSAIAHSELGDTAAQNNILRAFVVDVLRTSSELAVRSSAIATISRLKLEAGLPVEELEEIIDLIKEETNESGDDAENTGGEESNAGNEDSEEIG